MTYYTMTTANSAKALLIGINYINDPSYTLRSCVNDIFNVKNMLISSYNYNPANIVMLYDDSSNTITSDTLSINPISSLNYGLPTAEQILMRLQDIVDSSSKCSEIWIHYSGHGTQIIDISGDESIDGKDTSVDGKDECIVPCDFKTGGIITDDIIFNIIRNIKCKAVLVFDCCHSASICDLEWSFTNDSGLITRKQINNRNIINPNIYMFSGSKDNQVSLDMYNATKREFTGILTNSMMACLRNNNYTCSIQKLYLDICAYIKTYNQNSAQQPGFSSSYSIPSYYFIKSDAPDSLLNAIRAKTKIQNIQQIQANIRAGLSSTGQSPSQSPSQSPRPSNTGVRQTSINPALLLPKNLQLNYLKPVAKSKMMKLS